jgi:hypothetical protein
MRRDVRKGPAEENRKEREGFLSSGKMADFYGS